MKNKLRGFAGILVLMVGLMPAAAFADDGDNAAIQVQGITGVHLETDESDVATQASGTARVGEGGDREENYRASITIHHGGSDIEFHHENDNSQVDEDNGEIEIDHESAAQASSTVSDPEHVFNRGQLQSFLNHILKEDDNIGDVHVSSTSIETRYDTEAKFLWAIPAHMTATVTVNNDGTVSVTYPWYAFLFATQSDLGDKLTHALASSTIGASATASASTRAHLLDLIFSVLKGL